MRSSRPGRRGEKKQALKPPQRYSSTTFLAVCLAVALILLRIDVEPSEQTFEEFSSRTLGHCKESCHRALIAEYEKDGLKSYGGVSHLLASSAVDAMFTFRNRDIDDLAGLDDEEHEYPDYKQRADKSSKRGRTSAAPEKVTRESYLMNMPENLPPLIRTLIGVNYPSDASDEDRRRLVRPNRSQAGSLSEEIKRIEENMEDKSVAMVAAAAAAAVLSEDQRNTVSLSLRMKVYNDEWDNALRWISSWGKNIESDRNSQTSNAGGKRVSKRRGEVDGRYEGNRSREQQEILKDRLDKLFDKCTEQCLGDQGHMVSSKGSTVDRVEKPLYFKRLSRFYKSLEVLPKFTISARILRLSRNFLGVLISSAFIWLFRDVRGWWKLNQYSLSLKELLEEERNVVTITGSTKQQAKIHSSNKKKKKKCKRRDYRILSQLNGSQDGGSSVPCLTSYNGENNRWPEIEEDSDSDTSLQQMYMMRGGIQRNQTIVADNQSDQASKGTVSTSSCTTTDSIPTLDADSFKPESKDIMKKTESAQPKEKNNVYSSRVVLTNFPVPTTEQREEAAKRLREFQSKQLKKLIERKRLLNERSLYSPKMSMRDAVVKGLQEEQTKIPEVKVGISPPPGLVVEKPNESNIAADNYHGEDDDFGLKLTDILDEDDGDDLAQGSFQALKPSASRVNFDEYGTKSVALGDLLAPGTFKDSVHSNTHNGSSYNPWNSPSRSCYAGNRTSSDLDHNDDLSGNMEVDANIQLQVSAREFMPSWGKEGHTSPNDSKIW